MHIDVITGFHPPVCWEQSVLCAIPTVRCCFDAKPCQGPCYQWSGTNRQTAVTELIWLTHWCRHRFTGNSAKSEAMPVQIPAKACGVRFELFPSVELDINLSPSSWDCGFEEMSWNSPAELVFQTGFFRQRAPGCSEADRWLLALKVTSRSVSLRCRNLVLWRSALSAPRPGQDCQQFINLRVY